MDKVVVELTHDEAQLFALFRQHQNLFKLMLDKGVFQVHGGKATISFKPSGQVGSIVIQSLVYRE